MFAVIDWGWQRDNRHIAIKTYPTAAASPPSPCASHPGAGPYPALESEPRHPRSYSGPRSTSWCCVASDWPSWWSNAGRNIQKPSYRGVAFTEIAVCGKVFGQRVADFSFRPRFQTFFFIIIRKRVRPGRHDDNCKKGRRLATKVAAVLQQAIGWKWKAVLPRLPLSLLTPLFRDRSQYAARKAPVNLKVPVDPSLCTSSVRQSSLFVVDRRGRGSIKAQMEKKKKVARKSNSTEQGHNQDQAFQQLRTVLIR